MSCSALIPRVLPRLSWVFAVEHGSRAFRRTLFWRTLFLAQLCLSSEAQEIWLLARGAPRPQETVRDPQHGRYLSAAWAILMSRWAEHHLHTRDQQRRRRLGWGSLTRAGVDAHHLRACLSFNISLTDWNLGHPGCFSSFYWFLMSSSRDHL